MGVGHDPTHLEAALVPEPWRQTADLPGQLHPVDGGGANDLAQILRIGAGCATGLFGSHHWRGTDCGFDLAESLVPSRSGGSLAEIRWQSPCFGYKVHTVLRRQANLPVYVLVSPANVHDSLIGWLILLVVALLYSFRVLVVYADAAYFERRFFWVVFDILGAHTAVDYNLWRASKRKLAEPFFLRQWWRLVIRPRTDIERHFAWIKRYFGLKYFQCFTFLRVCQFVLLTYIAALAVTLAAQSYDHPELVRSRSMVLAHV